MWFLSKKKTEELEEATKLAEEARVQLVRERELLTQTIKLKRIENGRLS